MPKIIGAQVSDVRYPTADTLKGSDPFHRKPDYSATYLELRTDTPTLSGCSLVFTIGAGNDWIVTGIRDLATLLEGLEIETFAQRPGSVHRRLIDHHQIRWLGDAGVLSMAVGGIVNALWDLAAKSRRLPIWKYLAELPAETVVEAVNWRHIEDAITPGEALELLRRAQADRQRRVDDLQRGPKAYGTAAWSGLSDSEVQAACKNAVSQQKMESVKAKVGLDLEKDRHRLSLIRQAIGEEKGIRLDANQIWSVDRAIDWMKELASFRPIWIEEPTHPDDVIGYAKIKKALQPYGIGVAGGEHGKNPVLFKQFLSTQAIDYCQVDACRMAGLNDVLAVLLMAAKFKVPVCPHAGGIGLCNLVQHIGAFDLFLNGPVEGSVVEWIDFLGEAMQSPVVVREGRYVLPDAPGWGIELRPEFINEYKFPDGDFWRQQDSLRCGVRFEA